MKNLILATLVVTLTSLFSFSQNIALSGSVFTSKYKRNKNFDFKMYYSFDEDEYDGSNFVSINKDGTYIWKTDLEALKSDSIEIVKFTLDTIQSYAGRRCENRIRINDLIREHYSNSDVDVDIETDLIMEFYCKSTMFSSAKKDSLEKFVGSYELIDSLSARKVRLQNDFYRFSSIPNVNSGELVFQEYGNWHYFPNTKRLVINIIMKRNEKYGLFRVFQRRYSFTVSEANDELSFKSDSAFLTKYR